MEQTVYGDLLFFVNFCMDFQCLFLTAKFLHRPLSLWRALLSSALGALYACAALFLETVGWIAFLSDCGVCLLMCLLVFAARGQSFRQLLAPFGVYFVTSFAVGGVMSGMASLLSHIELPLGTGGESLSSFSFFLLAALGGVATFLWERRTAGRARGKKARLTLVLEGRELAVTCMVDTANFLRDPVGGRPVVLLSGRVARGFLDPELLSLAEQGDHAKIADLPPSLARRVRLIPAGTATGKGLLLAVAPDSALLDGGRGAVPVDILIAPTALLTDDDSYDGLLPAELIV